MGSKAPWHLWVVGALAVAWNAVGALDYVMTQTRNPGYMASFNAEQLAYFYGFPAWLVAAWAVAVWAAMVGSVLLLARRRLAVPVFALSLLGAAVTFAHNYLFSEGLRIMGGMGALVFSLVIVAVGAALLLYARAMAAHRVLR